MGIGLVGCGKANNDPVIQGFVNDFVADAALHGKNLTVDTIIMFGDVHSRQGGQAEDAVGICNVGPNGGTVTLDEKYWNRISDWSKKILIYHELGHCVLSRVHDTAMEEIIDMDNFKLEVPASIMNPNNLTPVAADSYTKALIDELFQ